MNTTSAGIIIATTILATIIFSALIILTAVKDMTKRIETRVRENIETRVRENMVAIETYGMQKCMLSPGGCSYETYAATCAYFSAIDRLAKEKNYRVTVMFSNVYFIRVYYQTGDKTEIQFSGPEHLCWALRHYAMDLLQWPTD